MPGRQLSPHAEQVLKERLRFCEEQQLYEGTAFFREALDTWDQAEFEEWDRIDDLSAHPKSRAELEEFRQRWGLTGLGEKDIRP